jgi:hypothetical protein
MVHIVDEETSFDGWFSVPREGLVCVVVCFVKARLLGTKQTQRLVSPSFRIMSMINWLGHGKKGFGHNRAGISL